MWRKFCGPLDIPLSLYQTKLGKVQACYISKQPLTAIQALKAHKSQYVWYATCFMTAQKSRLLIAQMHASKDALIKGCMRSADIARFAERYVKTVAYTLQVPHAVHQDFEIHLCKYTHQVVRNHSYTACLA
jgi:hypothetical protein